jgi:hypothetical protein
MKMGENNKLTNEVNPLVLVLVLDKCSGLANLAYNMVRTPV